MTHLNKTDTGNSHFRRWLIRLSLFALIMSPFLSNAQTLIAGWDFQTTTTGGTAITAAPGTATTLNANFGAGAIYLNGSNGSSTWTSLATNPELTSFGGTALNAGAGFSTTTSGASSLSIANNSANGKSMVFAFNMAGYSNLVVSYATRNTATGFQTQAWEFSTNATTWTPIETVSGLTTTFATKTLSTVTGLNNATTAYLRLIVNGATATTGNNRIDNIQLNATALTSAPVVTSNSATATVGVPFSYFISATGSPSSYASSALPSGLVLNTTTGEISGTPTAIGTSSITVDATNGLGTGSGTLSLTINQGTQTISGLSATDTRTYGDASYTLAATSNSGLPITYSSSDPLVASISGNTVSIIGAGSATITASQAGDANWSAATNVTQALTVNQATQTITFGALANKLTTDAPFALTATSATSGINPITYSSSNPLVATISGNILTIVGAGTTIITASQAGNANYLPATNVDQSQLVSLAGLSSQTITFNALTNATYGDAPINLTATASSGLPVTYSTTSTAISITGNVVTILTPGVATITASQAGNGSYYPATNVVQSLTINTKTLTLSGAVANNKAYDGTTTAIIDLTSATLNGVVGSDNVIAIGGGDFASSSVGTGINVITNLVLGGAQASYYTLTQPTLSADITQASQVITFGALPAKFYGNAPFAITATGGASVNPITFVSDNPSVADVVGNTVTIYGAGTANITASQAGDANYAAATDVAQLLTVGQAFNNITFAPLPSKVVGDAPFALTATATSGGTVTYTSSNPAVADVVGGVVTIYSIGSTDITASEAGNANYLPATNVVRTLSVTYPIIAAWDFFGLSNVATAPATTFDANLDVANNLITRGATAAASTGLNSFRTIGFKNEGISISNTDYFQTTLTADLGYTLSLSSINANLAGTASFANAPGVTSQFAYSLDGVNFTLIGSPIITTGTPVSLPMVNVTSISALQNVPAGTIVTIRYYASGQTTTGGWGFISAAAGVNGLAFGGSVNVAPPTNTIVNLTCLIEGYVDGNLSPVVAMRPVAMNQGVSGATATDCDVITVELHEAAAPYAMAAPAVSANLNINGLATATFAAVPTGFYWIAVRHRTSPTTWSAAPISITAGSPTSYNFTTAASQAFGSNMVDVNGSGSFAFFSGDVDDDEVIDIPDYSEWETDANNFGTGYLDTDLDGDGVVDLPDYSIWETNTNNFVAAVTP